MTDTQDSLRYSFYELIVILKYLPIEYTEKLPEKFKNLIHENKLSNGFIYDEEKSLDNQEVLIDTKILLSILYRQYWCTDDERKRLETQDEKILSEKYNHENLFKENIKINPSNIEENKYLEVTKDRWYKKLIKFIQRFIYRS